MGAGNDGEFGASPSSARQCGQERWPRAPGANATQMAGRAEGLWVSHLTPTALRSARRPPATEGVPGYFTFRSFRTSLLNVGTPSGLTS